MKSPLATTSSLIPVLSLIFLASARMLPIITLAPFFGSRILPHPVKITFALCLVTIVMPQILLKSTEPVYFDARLILLMMKEIFVGSIMGFFLGLPFLIVTASGVFIDHQRGAASLMVNDPTIQNQSSPIGTLYNFVLIVIFFTLDGPFFVIDSILDSYTLIPPDQFLDPQFFAPSSFVKDKLINSLQVFTLLALQLSAPAILAILMTDTFLGVINRLAPQVQITFLGMGLKSWLAIFMVLIGWNYFAQQMGKETIIWLREFMELIQGFVLKAAPGTAAPTAMTG
ncbi:MAG: flagellar biosynthetic protein FliR [Verrucomicrobia bacterium]|nr:flagellar biosynthetic protein FliR [Verrucomicrobiota bacterium]